MNILVIGCDQVGASLIRDLERIGHDISLIERIPNSSSVWMPLTTTALAARLWWATPPTRIPCGRAALTAAMPWPL